MALKANLRAHSKTFSHGKHENTMPPPPNPPRWFLDIVKFCLHMFEIMDESVDCEVHKKLFTKMFMPQRMEKHPFSNHDAPLEV